MSAHEARASSSPGLVASRAPTRELPGFESVYRAHFRFVWRSLRHLGVPERDLPDAVQEVFVVVHRKLPEFVAASRITTWLYAIALRVASTRRRRASERQELLVDPPERSQFAPAEASELADRRALLERALDAMPLEQRAVFTLFELEGAHGDEIAALLAVPVATVHSRLRLARETFRRIVARARARETFELVRIGEEAP